MILVFQRAQVDMGIAVVVPHGHERPRQEGRQLLDNADRAGTGPAAAVRRAKGLVQVEVHHVEAQLGRLRDAHDGVQVGAIAVDQSTGLVH